MSESPIEPAPEEEPVADEAAAPEVETVDVTDDLPTLVESRPQSLSEKLIALSEECRAAPLNLKDYNAFCRICNAVVKVLFDHDADPMDFYYDLNRTNSRDDEGVQVGPEGHRAGDFEKLARKIDKRIRAL